jgi:hypothetical protein
VRSQTVNFPEWNNADLAINVCALSIGKYPGVVALYARFLEERILQAYLSALRRLQAYLSALRRRLKSLSVPDPHRFPIPGSV